MREALIWHIRSEENLADLLTKVVTAQKRKHVVSPVIYEIYDEDT